MADGAVVQKSDILNSAVVTQSSKFTLRHLMKRHLAWLMVFLVPMLGFAQKKPGEAARIKSVAVQGAIKPGATVTAVVKVELEKGYHAHSHQPSEKQFVATILSLTAPRGVSVGPVKYPEGKSVTVNGLSKPLSVYEDEFEISVPLTLSANTTLPVRIPATLSYQACQGAVCYPPRKLRFDIAIIAAAKK